MFEEDFDNRCDVAFYVYVIHLTHCTAQKTHCLIAHPDILAEKEKRRGGGTTREELKKIKTERGE